MTSKFGKVVRYGGASAAALVVDVACIALLNLMLGMHYLVAAGIGFSLGCLVAFYFSATLVFNNGSGQPTSQLLLPFAVVGVLGLLLNQLILYVGVDILTFHVLAAKAVSAGIVFWFNFYLRGLHVFKDPDLC